MYFMLRFIFSLTFSFQNKVKIIDHFTQAFQSLKYSNIIKFIISLSYNINIWFKKKERERERL